MRPAAATSPMTPERNEPYDLFVIGGGINGAAVACDAAGRGLSVALAEERDFAEGTSSRSSKLIHGGLRYLETYDFRLVREALREREILMAKTPHLVWPIRLVLPHVPGLRPRWMIRLGLLLYDHLAPRRQLAASEAIDFARASGGRRAEARVPPRLRLFRLPRRRRPPGDRQPAGRAARMAPASWRAIASSRRAATAMPGTSSWRTRSPASASRCAPARSSMPPVPG